MLISFQTFALARYEYRSKTATNFTILQCCVTLSPMSAYFTMLFPIPLGQQIIEPLVCSTTKNPALKTITLLEFSSTFSNNIDKINNIAKYNLINTKYCQMAFWSVRWRCSRALFGNPWSNESEWWPPEGENPWNLLFSIRIQAQTKSNQGSKPWKLILWTSP